METTGTKGDRSHTRVVGAALASAGLALSASLYPAASPLHILEHLPPPVRIVSGWPDPLGEGSIQLSLASGIAGLKVADLAKLSSLLDQTSTHLSPKVLMTIVTTRPLREVLNSLSLLESATSRSLLTAAGAASGGGAGAGSPSNDTAARFTAFLEMLARDAATTRMQVPEALHEVLWAVMEYLGLTPAGPPAPSALPAAPPAMPTVVALSTDMGAFAPAEVRTNPVPPPSVSIQIAPPKPVTVAESTPASVAPPQSIAVAPPPPPVDTQVPEPPRTVESVAADTSSETLPSSVVSDLLAPKEESAKPVAEHEAAGSGNGPTIDTVVGGLVGGLLDRDPPSDNSPAPSNGAGPQRSENDAGGNEGKEHAGGAQ